MGTVPTGTGELRRIHSRVVCMFLPVDKSITVSAPQRVAQRIFSTSSSIEEATAELPMLALILTRKLRPMTIGSASGWLTLAGMIARPRATAPRAGGGPAQPRKVSGPAFLFLRRVLGRPRRQVTVVLRQHLAPLVLFGVA